MWYYSYNDYFLVSYHASMTWFDYAMSPTPSYTSTAQSSLISQQTMRSHSTVNPSPSYASQTHNSSTKQLLPKYYRPGIQSFQNNGRIVSTPKYLYVEWFSDGLKAWIMLLCSVMYGFIYPKPLVCLWLSFKVWFSIEVLMYYGLAFEYK